MQQQLCLFASQGDLACMVRRTAFEIFAADQRKKANAQYAASPGYKKNMKQKRFAVSEMKPNVLPSARKGWLLHTF